MGRRIIIDPTAHADARKKILEMVLQQLLCEEVLQAVAVIQVFKQGKYICQTNDEPYEPAFLLRLDNQLSLVTLQFSDVLDDNKWKNAQFAEELIIMKLRRCCPPSSSDHRKF